MCVLVYTKCNYEMRKLFKSSNNMNYAWQSPKADSLFCNEIKTLNILLFYIFLYYMNVYNDINEETKLLQHNKTL